MNFFLSTVLLLSFGIEAWAMENAKGLATGVRRVNIKRVSVDLARKYDNKGNVISLAQPLRQTLPSTMC